MEATGLGIPGISGPEQVGRTAATTTYRAVDDATGRPVIVTVLDRDATPEVRARFDYDQQRLVELADHPNIVTVLRHGYTEQAKPYVVREALAGESMADRVGAGMDGPSVLALGIRAAGAIESAHRRDVVHGDLRPEDILVDGDGEPEVADFGIAMVTGVGPDRATEVRRLAHASPEQLQTHLPTPASDVYALGSVLYALLAGGPAFVRPDDVSVAAVGARIIAEPPPDLRALGVPAPVVDAIERAMQKDPAARWSSAEAFGLALQQAEVTLGLPITPMTVVGPDRVVARPVVDDDPGDAAPAAPAPPPSRSKAPLVLGAAALVLVVAVVLFLVLGGGDGDGDRPTTTFTRPPEVDIELESFSDDSGTITIGVLDSWDSRDGRPLDDGQGGEQPDLVAASEDSDGFLQLGGFTISGVEVTVIDDVDDAELLLEDRALGRGLAQSCTTDRAPREAEVAGFDGFQQRFDGCSGNGLVLFAGVDGGRGLVVEVHLVEREDEQALEAVLDSIEIAG